MKKLLIVAAIFVTLILACSVNTFGLVQLNLEDAINGKCNGADYTELSLSGNVVLPVIGIKIDGEYDSMTISGSSANLYMAGAGFRLVKLSGLSLFVGGEYLGYIAGSIVTTALMYDASLTWRINKHMSVDAWMGNSLSTSVEGISIPSASVFAYRGRFTYWIIQNIGVSAGIHGTTFRTGVPGADLNFSAIYLGAALGL